MSRRKYLRRLIFTLLASTAIPSLGLALEPSGTTVKVSNHANASGPGGVRVLNAPGDVFQGDQIVTDGNGQAQIRFVDDTRFVVGPNSRVVIDEFLFKPDGTATAVALNAVKGTFRFITGKSPKEAYTLNTPTMSIGVRGTIIDLRVLISGESLAAWQEGSGQACVAPQGAAESARTMCEDAGPGTVIGSVPGGGFKNFQPGEQRQALVVLNSGLGPGLAPEFKVSNGAINVGGGPQGGTKVGRDEPPSPPGSYSPPSDLNYP
jgi:FecR protein